MRVREIKRFMAYCINMHFDEEESVERIFVFFSLIGTIVPIKFSIRYIKIKIRYSPIVFNKLMSDT